jgi:nitroimidazol reductase NimA-like FMN-containing flavoprotein (pyridoxamine 5'-phosphate oxidase superfamily)
MRRRDREITDKAAIESIIRRSLVCRLGLSKGDQPYVVPLCFGYEDGTLYFHCAREGMKVDILRANDAVCVEFDIDQELVRGNEACGCAMRYRSAIAFGRASFVEGADAKRKALDVLMRQYSDESHEYSDEALAKVTLVKVDIESMTGKQSGY